MRVLGFAEDGGNSRIMSRIGPKRLPVSVVFQHWIMYAHVT
jgi:hypothetical protein